MADEEKDEILDEEIESEPAQSEVIVQQKKKPNIKHKKPQTGGLQAKKIVIPPTKEELKLEQKQEKTKRREKQKARRKDRPNIFVRFWLKIREVISELRKVIWPTFPRAVTQTGVVLGFVVVFSIIIFGMDMGLGQLFQLLTRNLD